jgi:hypothetical protein
MHTQLKSPVGQYQPELLVLAPESGDDPNMLSLVSQFLELGVPIELDEGWHLPTKPPKDLSAYKACLFPESARPKYDKDLDKFYEGGGHLIYTKYYPVAAGRNSPADHPYFLTYARDVYFFSMANVILEGGLSTNDPAFRRTMQSRPASSILAEYRNWFFGKYDRLIERWQSWGDTTYTMFLSNLFLARKLKDQAWLDLVERCIEAVGRAVPDALVNTEPYQELRIPGVVQATYGLHSSVLMWRGHERQKPELAELGMDAAVFYVKHLTDAGGGVFREKWMKVWWGESMIPLMPLYWLAKLTGKSKHARMADAILRKCCAMIHRADGLWHHYSNDSGSTKSACWSRGQFWPMLWMIESLPALDPGGETASFMLKEIRKTLDALRRVQNPSTGLWHLVADEPQTRCESSATAGIIYCHDRLHDMGLLGKEYSDMIERAFLGLKGLYYRGGLAASCRGTATGTPDYYRTRPMGWYEMSLFPASLATRVDSTSLRFKESP